MPLFNQNSPTVRRNLPYSFLKYPEGVCSALVMRWLVANGNFAKASLDIVDGTRDCTLDEWVDLDLAICRDMDLGRKQMFQNNNAGIIMVSRFESNEFESLLKFITVGGTFYLALIDPSTGAKHALGIIYRAGKLNVFDPNQIAYEMTTDTFQTLLNYYAKGEAAPPGADGKPQWTLTNWEVTWLANGLIKRGKPMFFGESKSK